MARRNRSTATRREAVTSRARSAPIATLLNRQKPHRPGQARRGGRAGAPRRRVVGLARDDRIDRRDDRAGRAAGRRGRIPATGSYRHRCPHGRQLALRRADARQTPADGPDESSIATSGARAGPAARIPARRALPAPPAAWRGDSGDTARDRVEAGRVGVKQRRHSRRSQQLAPGQIHFGPSAAQTRRIPKRGGVQRRRSARHSQGGPAEQQRYTAERRHPAEPKRPLLRQREQAAAEQHDTRLQSSIRRPRRVAPGLAALRQRDDRDQRGGVNHAVGRAGAAVRRLWLAGNMRRESARPRPRRAAEPGDDSHQRITGAPPRCATAPRRAPGLSWAMTGPANSRSTRCSAGLPHRLPPRRVAGQRADRLGEAGDITWRDQQSGLAVAHHLTAARDVGRVRSAGCSRRLRATRARDSNT